MVSKGTRRWGSVLAHCIAMLETKIKILDVELQVREDELSTLVAQGAIVSSRNRNKKGTVLLLGSFSI
jgi:hypothetical protein